MSEEKQALIATLRECSLLMELRGDNPFRCRAYENGARVLEGLEGGPRDWLAGGLLAQTRGIGKGLADRVREWVESGRIEEIEQLRAGIPAGVVRMLSIPGLGPRKIRQLWQNLGVTTIEELEAAARDGRVAGLAGFGEKTAAKIMAGIEQRRQHGERMTIERAAYAAELLLGRLRAHPAIGRVELAGSLRRARETVKDLDLIATSSDPAAIMKLFVETPGVEEIVAHGPTKSSIRLTGGVPADLRVVSAEQFAAGLQYFTGSKEHNTALRGRARRMGLKLNEYGLFREGEDEPLPTPDEASIYRQLGLAYIEPELRENLGEIEAAEAGALPDLIGADDMRGVLHCHSTWSDGHNSIEQMAEACRRAGYRYLGICDHSQSVHYAHGVRPDELLAMREQIERLRGEMGDFDILAGAEVDILGDGSLDYDDGILAGLDLVVGAIHSRLSMDGAALTERICRALAHPALAILAHPSGRLLLRREPSALDWEKIFATAATHNVAIEINSNPWRLDLDWRLIRQAKAAGCRFAINPDAHDTAGIADIRYGIGVARKGWLTRADVINTMSAAELREWLRARRQR